MYLEKKIVKGEYLEISKNLANYVADESVRRKLAEKFVRSELAKKRLKKGVSR